MVWLENDLLPGKKVEAVPKVARVMMRTGWKETDPPAASELAKRVRPTPAEREPKLSKGKSVTAIREPKPNLAQREAIREAARMAAQEAVEKDAKAAIKKAAAKKAAATRKKNQARSSSASK